MIFRKAKTVCQVFLDWLLQKSRNRIKRVNTEKGELVFFVSGRLSASRVETFFTKEPDTLAWIESFPENSIFWDVGANVGLYSCFAALLGHKVVAVEPSAFNIELLAKNVSYNQGDVIVVPLPLTNYQRISTMSFSNDALGGALAAYGVDYGWDGEPIDSKYSIKYLGVTIDQLVNTHGLPTPDFLKIDVDGIEHLILQGATNTLKGVRQILVEVNESFYQQKTGVIELLEASGFRLEARYQSEQIANSDGGFASCFNYLWTSING